MRVGWIGLGVGVVAGVALAGFAYAVTMMAILAGEDGEE